MDGNEKMWIHRFLKNKSTKRSAKNPCLGFKLVSLFSIHTMKIISLNSILFRGKINCIVLTF